MFSVSLETSKAIYLAILQGFTEFLPISSSGHLILASAYMGDEARNISFITAVHFGSLIAVILYFRRDLVTISGDWGKSLIKKQTVGDSRLFWAVMWGTIPAGLYGLVLYFLDDERIRSGLLLSLIIIISMATVILYFAIRKKWEYLRQAVYASLVMVVLIALALWLKEGLQSAFITALMSILFGVALWISDVKGKRDRGISSIGWRDVLIIGVAQACALIPGTSRSGITITAALLLGFSRQTAARFSFLLSIPVIVLATLSQTYKLFFKSINVEWDILAYGLVISAVTAYICIHYFLKLIERIGMLPFVAYRILLGIVMFYFIYSGALQSGL